MKVLRPLVVMLSLLVAAMAAADHPSTLDHMLRQVKEANSREAAVRAEREQRFLHAKADREQLLAQQRERVADERARGAALKQRFEANEQELQTLEADLQASSGNLGELFGTVRQVANDLQALMHDSLVSAQFPGRADWFDTLATSKKLPDITELERLWLLMQQEINESGRVASFVTDVVGADGLTARRTVTRVGVFDAVSGGRFLSYLPDSGQLVELSRQPERRYRALADTLTQRSQGYAPMLIDPTRGALLGLLVQAPTLMERLHQGGIIGYIIVALAVLGLLIVVQRLAYLGLVHRRVRCQLADPESLCDDNPLGRVLAAGKALHAEDLETLEMQLDEAILRELPRLTRGQSLVKLLAAVAPLLGLLGTVTGMILTFQSISLFGTGDPKLMASGISQALVTTGLGLSVAIPLLFLHSLIASRSRVLIQILDQQSAALVVRRNGVG
jgi:biopolymer transport protein ExbB